MNLLQRWDQPVAVLGWGCTGSCPGWALRGFDTVNSSWK